MLKIVVRSSSDASAVRAMVERFYPSWELEVLSMHGARSPGEMLRELMDIVDDEHFFVVMLGREDAEAAEKLRMDAPPNTVVHVVPRARVRNARLDMLAWEFEVARARIRLGSSWCEEKESYVFSPKPSGLSLEAYEYDPVHDQFLVLGEGSAKLLSRVLGMQAREGMLVVRGAGGEHLVYSGPRVVARLVIPDEGLRVECRLLRREARGVSIERLVEANQKVLDMFEHISLRFLKREVEKYDNIVVTWSGGKDSTAALLLTLKLLPRNRVTVIHADTGLEFPESLEYVEEVSRKLGITPVEVKADVAGELESGRKPLPTHEDRWCRDMKVEAIEKKIREIAREGSTLVVVGDRDAESEARAKRPPIREGGGVKYIAPLRHWGTAHVQLYLLREGVGLNKLYLNGFYRIGCFICPSLRSWELLAMKVNGVRESVCSMRVFREFLESKKALEVLEEDQH